MISEMREFKKAKRVLFWNGKFNILCYKMQLRLYYKNFNFYQLRDQNSTSIILFICVFTQDSHIQLGKMPFN